jgi:predicted  nucleic acid-binding Zn-ribbon protein
MNGFFRNDGTWVQQQLAAQQGSAQEALRALTEAIERVKNRKRKARDELRELLCKHPILQQELKGQTEQNPLQLLVNYYAAEALGMECKNADPADQ